MSLFLAFLVALGMPDPAVDADAALPPAGSPPAELLRRANEARSRHGLPPLIWSRDLAALARAHARDMRARGQLSHTGSDGAGYSDRLAGAGLAAMRAAENIALDRDAAGAHGALMDSPGHRANLLDGRLTHAGMGVVAGAGGQIWVVQDFATLMDVLTPAAAGRRLVAALQAARTPPLDEADAISRRLQSTVADMIRTDGVDVPAPRLDLRGWFFSYTCADPARLPPDLRARLPQAGGFGAAIRFASTASAPLGLYWVAVLLPAAPEGE